VRRHGFVPEGRVEPLAEDVWVEEAWIRFYGVPLRTRMAVIALPGRRLLLYSPVPWTPAVDAAVASLGRPAFLVSPNKIHNQTLAEWTARHPAASLWAPPGLRERRPDLPVAGILGDAPPSDWGGGLDLVLTRGNVFFSEALLFHRRSRTLLVGDLVEQLVPGTTTPFGHLLARAFGAGAAPAPSPEFRLYTEDADAAAAAFARVAGFDFERIFLCHGALVTTRAHEVYAEVTRSVVDAARRRSPLARRLLRALAALQ
jgi:hypothetical protein